MIAFTMTFIFAIWWVVCSDLIYTSTYGEGYHQWKARNRFRRVLWVCVAFPYYIWQHPRSWK